MTRARDIATLKSGVLGTSLEGKLSCRQIRHQLETPPGGHRRPAPTAGARQLVDGALIELCAASGADRTPIVLAVRAPVELAARFWDAEFDVRVHDVGGRSVLSVVDPFGREIVLARRRTPVLVPRRQRLSCETRTS